MTKPSTHGTKEPGALFPRVKRKIFVPSEEMQLNCTWIQAGDSRKLSQISWHSYNFSCKMLIFLGCVIGYIKITHSTYSLFTSASMQHSNWLSTFISIFSWFILNVGGAVKPSFEPNSDYHCSRCALCNRKTLRRIINRFSSFFAKRIIFSRNNWLAHFWLDFNIKVELRTNEARSSVVVIFIASIKNVIIAKLTSHSPNSKS